MLTFRAGGPAGSDGVDLVSRGEIYLAQTPSFSLGGLHVDPPTLQVVTRGVSRTIEPRVMQVLVALAAARGAVVSRDRLIEQCWAGRAVSEDAINRGLAKVRRLGEETEAFEIETIPRVGYRLIEAGVAPVSLAAQAPRQSWPRMTVGLLLLLVLAGGGLWYWRSIQPPQQPTVAVLPFAAVGADREASDLGQDITASVASSLVQIGARVPGGNLRTIDDARRAGAAMIVSGSIEHDGPLFRVMVRVDSARSNSALLTNEFAAPANSNPKLADVAAQWLAPAVRMWASFLPIESDPAVTDEIMRIFLTRLSNDFPREWKLARNLAAAKPQSASAQWLYALLAYEQIDDTPIEDRPALVASARAAAKRSAAGLPKSGRSSILLDCYFTAPGFPVLAPGCDRTTRAALSSDPDIPVLSSLFGHQLMQSGRFSEATKFLDMDLAAMPLGRMQLMMRINAGLMTNGGDDALPDLEAKAHRYLGPFSTDGLEFEAAIANGDIDRATKFLDGPKFADPTTRLVVKTLASRSSGSVVAMRRICSPTQPGGLPQPPEHCLAGFVMTGDLDSFFALATRMFPDVQCCSRAYQEQQWLARGGGYPESWMLFGKAFATARADARFVELSRRTGLLAYWKSGHPPDFCQTERVPVCALLRAR